jgi:HPt (histidine-containing phosphotransfer) domain-containing protein
LRYEAGVRLVAGNHAMYRRLLRDFAREHREDVSAIGTALALQDIERAERLAHTLKGVTGAIGAEAAYQAAADLDEALRQGLEPSDCRPLVEALRLAMEPLLADLHAVFPPR